MADEVDLLSPGMIGSVPPPSLSTQVDAPNIPNTPDLTSPGTPDYTSLLRGQVGISPDTPEPDLTSPGTPDYTSLPSLLGSQVGIPDEQLAAGSSRLDQRGAAPTYSGYPDPGDIPRPPAEIGRYADSTRADPYHQLTAGLTGRPTNLWRAIGSVESTVKGVQVPDLAPNRFGYTGLYQQGRENVPNGWQGDLRDPVFNAQVTANTARKNEAYFQRQFGRLPDGPELYLLHNQGIAGGPALTRASQLEPDLPAYQALSKYYGQITGRYMSPRVALSHISNNMWQEDMKGVDPAKITAGQYVGLTRKGINDRISFYNARYGGQSDFAQINSSPADIQSAQIRPDQYGGRRSAPRPRRQAPPQQLLQPPDRGGAMSSLAPDLSGYGSEWSENA